MNTIKKIDLILNKIESALLILFLLVMILMAFAQVVLRNFFSGGIVWGDILLRHLVLWIGMLGASLATSNDRHLNIDALTRFFSPFWKNIIASFTNFFGSAVCFILFKASLTFIGWELESENKIFGIPSVYAQIIIPIGFALLTFHFLVRALINSSNIFKKGNV